LGICPNNFLNIFHILVEINGCVPKTCFQTLLLPIAWVSSAGLKSLSSTSSDFGRSVRSTKNQFQSRMSIIWVTQNSVMSLLASNFVSAENLQPIIEFVEDYNKLWHTPTLLKRLKCKSKNENNGRNWGTLPSSNHFGGKRGMLELGDGD
jgi:hypothetical protein